MSLTVSEAFCYICRSVLIEPVTVPCLHVFCYSCFEQSMQETSYSCPLCRKRISNWVRTAKKSNKLVNTELWKKIKEQFNDQVHRKLKGEDDGLDARLQEECPTPTRISKPGEVAEEFSKLINDFESEAERSRQAEEEASKEILLRLAQEENERLEEIRKQNQLIAEKDEELARKIQEEINQELPSSSQSHSSHSHNKVQIKEIKKVSKGPMDNFLQGNTPKLKNGFKPLCFENISEGRSASAGSSDSIQSEMHHFKPIKVVPRTPPKQHPDGKIVEINLTKVPPVKMLNTINIYESFNSGKITASNKKIHSPYSAFIGKSLPSQGDSHESPCKRLRFTSDEPESGVLKEITLGENSDSNSMSTSDADLKSQDEIRKRRNSPVLLPKPSNSIKKQNFFLPPDIFKFKKIENDSAEENENEEFDTQDYLAPDSNVEEKLIEEQKRIEQLILQEKQDRELALKLSREWGRKYELRNKPKTRQTPAKKKTPKGFENKKVQQTLIDSLVTKRRNGK